MSQAPGSRLGWYARRLARMSPAELGWRARDQAVQLAWSRRQVQRGQVAAVAVPDGPRRFPAVLPAGAAAAVPAQAAAAVLSAADRLLRGEWEVLGVERTDLAGADLDSTGLTGPDWFTDPVTGRRSDPDRYCFRVAHRSEEAVGNVKQVWEIARLQHLTLAATAWYLSGKPAYAELAAAQLRSFWQQNPFLSGVHWTSGIEVGLRLISFAWIRRLLDDWPGVAALFDDNPLAVAQIGWHQRFLAAFRSRGSSANNHVIAEAAGQLTASCAFDWFPESARWRRQAARLLENELIRNTFPSGIGRELASDYHGFVAELALVAAVEAGAAGHPLSARAWDRLAAMADGAAALVDETLRPPRQGDGDEGRALLLDPPEPSGWPSVLGISAAVLGRLDWWPAVPASAAAALVGALAGEARPAAGRPAERPWRFPDAGLTILRTEPGEDPEIWCRCDGGPHGFLSIAAHAHADALSVEVRHGGTDILADPGTYCYHGDPAWRAYFRSTIAHNTVELAGRSQSGDGGPFLWTQHANGRETKVANAAGAVTWVAEHNGYATLNPAARHQRAVRLDRAARVLEITDEVTGAGHQLRLAFHLGPDVTAELSDPAAGSTVALLQWPGPAGTVTARLALPAGLDWSLHRGETDPIAGWYSDGLGRRRASYTLLGSGLSHNRMTLVTRLEFHDSAESPKQGISRSGRILPRSRTGDGTTAGVQAEAG